MKTEQSRFFQLVDKAEDICLVAMFALMVAAIFLQIIMRFVFNNSLVWSEELGKFIFVWISWVGLSIGERRNEHIKITLVTDRFSPKVQKIFEIISYLVLTAILLVIIYYAVILVRTQSHIHYAGIKISISWGYLSLIVGCGIMLLRVFGVIYRDISALVRKDYNASSHPGMIDQVADVVEQFDVSKGGE